MKQKCFLVTKQINKFKEEEIMKITAEFNSNEELLNFISTFGTTTNIIQK